MSKRPSVVEQGRRQLAEKLHFIEEQQLSITESIDTMVHEVSSSARCLLGERDNKKFLMKYMSVMQNMEKTSNMLFLICASLQEENVPEDENEGESCTDLGLSNLPLPSASSTTICSESFDRHMRCNNDLVDETSCARSVVSATSCPDMLTQTLVNDTRQSFDLPVPVQPTIQYQSLQQSRQDVDKASSLYKGEDIVLNTSIDSAANTQKLCVQELQNFLNSSTCEDTTTENLSPQSTAALPVEIFESGKTLNVIVTEVINPSMFWVQPVGPDLDDLMDEISHFYGKHGRRVPLKDVYLGMECCALYSKDKSWYRARVVATHIASSASYNDGNMADVEVLYLDYGNCERLRMDNLRNLEPRFTTLPSQAFCCALSEVAPPHGLKEWGPEHAIEFSRLVRDRPLQAVISPHTTDCPVVFADLYYPTENQDPQMLPRGGPAVMQNVGDFLIVHRQARKALHTQVVQTLNCLLSLQTNSPGWRSMSFRDVIASVMPTVVNRKTSIDTTDNKLSNTSVSKKSPELKAPFEANEDIKMKPHEVPTSRIQDAQNSMDQTVKSDEHWELNQKVWKSSGADISSVNKGINDKAEENSSLRKLDDSKSTMTTFGTTTKDLSEKKFGAQSTVKTASNVLSDQNVAKQESLDFTEVKQSRNRENVLSERDSVSVCSSVVSMSSDVDSVSSRRRQKKNKKKKETGKAPSNKIARIDSSSNKIAKIDSSSNRIARIDSSSNEKPRVASTSSQIDKDSSAQSGIAADKAELKDPIKVNLGDAKTITLPDDGPLKAAVVAEKAKDVHNKDGAVMPMNMNIKGVQSGKNYAQSQSSGGRKDKSADNWETLVADETFDEWLDEVVNLSNTQTGGGVRSKSVSSDGQSKTSQQKLAESTFEMEDTILKSDEQTTEGAKSELSDGRPKTPQQKLIDLGFPTKLPKDCESRKDIENWLKDGAEQNTQDGASQEDRVEEVEILKDKEEMASLNQTAEPLEIAVDAKAGFEEQETPELGSTREQSPVSYNVSDDGIDEQPKMESENIEVSKEVPTVESAGDVKEVPHGDSKVSEITQMLESLNLAQQEAPHNDDGSIQVMMAHVVNPSEFYVHLVLPEAKELDPLMEQLENHYRNLNNFMLNKFLGGLSKGDICCAQYSEDGAFYRAEITDVRDSGDYKVGNEFKVFYMDYGNSEWLPSDKVLPLMPQFRKLPAFAYQCSLKDVYPVHGTKWSKESVKGFEKLAPYDRALLGYVLHRKEGSSPTHMQMILVNTTGESDVWINRELVSLGLAKSKPSVEQPKEVSDETASKTSTVCAMGEWDPMKEDFDSIRNSYEVDVDDAGVATVGYRSSKSTKRVRCR